jgi:hypothetical protein
MYKYFYVSVFIIAWIVAACTNRTAPNPTPVSTEFNGNEPTPIASKSDNLDIPKVSLPPQGMYDGCVPTRESCLNDLNTLAAKGFKLIVNYDQLYGDSKSQIAYADRAYALGMKVIWSIPYRDGRPDDWMIDYYPEFSSSLRCKDNYCLIEKFVNLVKDHPATWGYYVADEVRPEAYERMEKWSDLIKSLDPAHPRLYVTAGSNDPMEQYYGFYSKMNKLAEVFGPCYYPYGYIETGTKVSEQTGETARHAQYWADKLSGKSVIVLQAFSWSRYAKVPLCFPWPGCAPFPSYEQMKAQRDQVLLNSTPEMILWWTYEDILKTDNPTKHLQELADAAFAPLPSTTLSKKISNEACFVGWNCEDIGNPKIEGMQFEKDQAWIVKGSGWDIWDKPWVRADQFHFVWKKFEGDGNLQSKVDTTFDQNRFKAGIMFRSSVDPISPYYAVLIADDSKIHVQIRSEYGGKSSEVTAISLRNTVYLKIQRDGSVYSAYISQDGSTWNMIPGSRVQLSALDGMLMAGVAATSRSDDLLSTSVFSEVRFSGNHNSQ